MYVLSISGCLSLCLVYLYMSYTNLCISNCLFLCHVYLCLISIYIYVSFYLCVYPSICLCLSLYYIHLYVYVYLCVYPSICLYLSLLISIYIYVSNYLCISIHLYVSVYLCLYKSTYMSLDVPNCLCLCFVYLCRSYIRINVSVLLLYKSLYISDLFRSYKRYVHINLIFTLILQMDGRTFL